MAFKQTIFKSQVSIWNYSSRKLKLDSEESCNDKSYRHCDPHCSVVDTLISQVYKLENRINQIEINSEASTFGSLSSNNSTIIPRSEMSEDNYKSREFHHSDNYIISSTKSTPQKPKTKLTVGSLPSTPPFKLKRTLQRSKLSSRSQGKTHQLHDKSYQSQSTDESSFNSTTPEKIDNQQMLGEIDKFLNSVKTIQAVRSAVKTKKNLNNVLDPTTQNFPEESINFDNPVITLSELKTMEESNKRFNELNLQQVNRLLETIDSQTEILNVNDRRVEALYENKSFCTSKDSWNCGQEEGSVPSFGYGMKELMSNEASRQQSKKSWNCGSVESSVPNLGYGMRNIIYNASEETVEGTRSKSEATISKSEATISKSEATVSKSEATTTDTDYRKLKKSESRSDSDITEPTIVEKVSNQTESSRKYNSSSNEPTTTSSRTVLNSQNQESEILPESEELDHYFTNHKFLQNTLVDLTGTKSLPINLSNISFSRELSQPASNSGSNINLFSLADIWNTGSSQDISRDIKLSEKEMKKLIPRLEEEKCRRKHCEKLINELQIKILEMQQRLAVAIQVDSAKDEAILRFHEAWEKVANRWKSLETERNSLSKQLYIVEQKSTLDLAEASKKISHYESEVSKAINLAHKSQEKCNILEQERENLLKRLQDLGIQLKSSQENLKDVSKHKEQISLKLSQLEKESLKDKKLLLEAQNEVTQSRSSFLSCHSDLITLKEDYGKLQNQIKEERALVFDLETEKNNLHLTLEKLQKSDEALKNDMKILREESDRSKSELRNFYQKQVEILVKDKLKEFQQQLEVAEKSLQEELLAKEQSVAKQAAKQLNKLTEKHRLEVHLIEQKHKEEVRLYELQFNQMKQQALVLQSKLEHYQTKQSTIAQELHSVMEAQWIEALRIINQNKSPDNGSPHLDEDLKKPTTVNISPAAASLEEIKKILAAKNKYDRAVDEAGDDFKLNSKDYLKFKSKHTITDQVPMSTHSFDMYETPVSSKSLLTQQMPQPPHDETELQKYIRLLLNDFHKNSTEHTMKTQKYPDKDTNSQDSSNSDLNDVASSWQQIPTRKEQEVSANNDRSAKPPWK